MKRTNAALLAVCTLALACSIGALYSVVTPNGRVNQPSDPAPSIEAVYDVGDLPSPSAVVLPSSAPQTTSAPAPTKKAVVKVQTVEEPEPEPTNDWVEIKPNPEDSTNAQGHYVGPTRSPSR
jgi:hypothetical protein